MVKGRKRLYERVLKLSYMCSSLYVLILHLATTNPSLTPDTLLAIYTYLASYSSLAAWLTQERKKEGT